MTQDYFPLDQAVEVGPHLFTRRETYIEVFYVDGPCNAMTLGAPVWIRTELEASAWLSGFETGRNVGQRESGDQGADNLRAELRKLLGITP